ncbi:tRNA-dihydrouridine(20/20a) synthase [Litorimonas cladophorae]|uniref:tRNA-dihydrouridine(20/20a) synthase n=1 Tax=Litorimonas cladophorae TaxID=1220491 RepID=A0A918NDP6_9PROT|nr:tRNA dihydrouridine(20/20a) synthase DusA [Litorimonas cladophorae]GGX60359.1 tRNA-dihydrouridine(20/20a) synthase [Litorimonas cladophorae]
MNTTPNISVAPMMDWTDRHCRWFHRQLSAQTRLYTEMVVADAVIHGPRDHLLGFHDIEHVVALQIGGSDPAKLAQATAIGAGYGYDEINLNVGCPSDRVQAGRFGATLMSEAPLVGECFRAMADATEVEVTVKCRLGIDDQDVHIELPRFIETVASAGCKTFIIHARKAWLKGLSPKDNRTIPPIDYNLVHAMKARFPDLEIIVNGQLEDVSHAAEIMGESLDGAMFGRAAYNTPWILTEVDSHWFAADSFQPSRLEIAERLIGYAESQEGSDRSTKALIRHVMGLFAGEPGARLWRRTLSENLSKKLPPSEILREGLSAMLDVSRAA